MTIVIKIGGAALEDASTLRKCARAIAELAQDGHRVAVVHGGGTALTRVLKQLGKQSQFVSGLRVTDAETRDVALMVLGGIVVAVGMPLVPFFFGAMIGRGKRVFLVAFLIRTFGKRAEQILHKYSEPIGWGALALLAGLVAWLFLHGAKS